MNTYGHSTVAPRPLREVGHAAEVLREERAGVRRVPRAAQRRGAVARLPRAPPPEHPLTQRVAVPPRRDLHRRAMGAVHPGAQRPRYRGIYYAKLWQISIICHLPYFAMFLS